MDAPLVPTSSLAEGSVSPDAPPPSRLILASASPRRRDLLHSIGIRALEVCPADMDETPLPRERPTTYVARMAQGKAQIIAARQAPTGAGSGAYILGADTIVSMGLRIFQKAPDADAARHQMATLSGRRHRVYTALCLITPEGRCFQRLATTHVTLKRLHEVELARFIDSREWEGVCCYRLQGLAGAFVKQMQGTPSNVMGLPVYELNQLLNGQGFVG